MTPTRKPRNYRRVAQACSTCKRKKIRCTGEKPHCSHCVRLRQRCQYPQVLTDRSRVTSSISSVRPRQCTTTQSKDSSVTASQYDERSESAQNS
ncbi:hypothetical protein M011DRAFT_472452 [Sporormia fimetaria CBS 119925]|uniref:Zn(2)-C6 fungal-type domain-containing protein n=1 Tax=Sporormia fimetaria CBS 119925 TaxID=1340428 RepID=A0A6A6UXB3_9PLEO|nr:hypothetical protein M011DRAFT_472452 [Sporormia fimetaria CBS 119925]